VTSDARALPQEEAGAPAPPPEDAAREDTADETAAGEMADDDARTDEGRDRRSRLSLPLVPTLAVLLVLLLAAAGYLWFTRPEASPVRADHYVEALQAARSGIVDFTSFDHLTLDDDIEQLRRVATGDLREESVAELESRREEIVQAEAVVSTEVVGAGVTRADGDEATALLVIQSTQESNVSPQAQVVKYRIEVELQKVDGRWLLSTITGTDQ
jgi:Mce-associated membrane protein